MILENSPEERFSRCLFRSSYGKYDERISLGRRSGPLKEVSVVGGPDSYQFRAIPTNSDQFRPKSEKFFSIPSVGRVPRSFEPIILKKGPGDGGDALSDAHQIVESRAAEF